LTPRFSSWARRAAGLFAIRGSPTDPRSGLTTFADRYMRAINAARVTFAEVVRKNLVKTVGRFLPPDYPNLPDFDRGFKPEEQLPRQFAITIDSAQQRSQLSAHERRLHWRSVDRQHSRPGRIPIS